MSRPAIDPMFAFHLPSCRDAKPPTAQPTTATTTSLVPHIHCDKRDNEPREPTELQTVIVLVHRAQSE